MSGEVQVVKKSWGRPKGSRNSLEARAKIRAWFGVSENRVRHRLAVRAGILRARMEHEPKEVEKEEVKE